MRCLRSSWSFRFGVQNGLIQNKFTAKGAVINKVKIWRTGPPEFKDAIMAKKRLDAPLDEVSLNGLLDMLAATQV
jgi:hypothetical protein